MNAHNVKHGDIIIVGSDGLWDNIHRQKIVQVVNNFVKGGHEIKDAELVAEILAKEAEKYSYQ